MKPYKKKIEQSTIPSDFDKLTVDTINRIENNTNVLGVMYFRNSVLELCTVPNNMERILSKNLPTFTSSVQQAVGEIDILDEFVAYRVMTNAHEIIVVANKDFASCVTASLNQINPIVDRIMEDDSVEGVVMTNKAGVPILTNINLVGATNYGLAMKRLGEMTQIGVKEIDTFDEVLVLRIQTKKIEIMVAPNPEFNIIVMQHARVVNKTSKRHKEK